MSTQISSAHPHPDVVYTELQNGEAVLLHLDTQTYYSLNETGTLIWQSVEQGLPVSDISQKLQEQYEVAPTQAQQSVTTLLQDLAAADLVTIDPAPAPSA